MPDNFLRAGQQRLTHCAERTLVDGKDLRKAAELCVEGNAMHHNNMKRYMDAVKLYNRSIAHSTNGSQQRAQAYWQRSKVCVKLKRYADCLQNIKLARASDGPGLLRQKLNLAEQCARRMLLSVTDDATPGSIRHEAATLKLSFPAYENAPRVANCLVMRRNPRYGRYLETNKALKVGDVVMIDNPYASVLEPEFCYVRCDHCQRPAPFTLIPCEHCTNAMYCSFECLSSARTQYHEFECRLVHHLAETTGDPFVLLAWRAVARTIGTYRYNLRTLKQRRNMLSKIEVNPLLLDWVDGQNIAFSAVHILASLARAPNDPVEARAAQLAWEMHCHLVSKTKLTANYDPDSVPYQWVGEMCYHFLKVMQCNARPAQLMRRDEPEGRYRAVPFALRCYPLISLLNHSCAPNVKCFDLRDGRCAVVVIQPIAAGGQLFANYGYDYLQTGRDERREGLQRDYGFSCNCNACENNYPTAEPFHSNRVDTILRTRDMPEAARNMAKLLAEVKEGVGDGRVPHQQLAELERYFQLLYCEVLN
uniref:SET domain-containing protein n=1 Tax=Anopheles melas TaxID=34690 RepID=A0A182TSF8_9DIPT